MLHTELRGRALDAIDFGVIEALESFCHEAGGSAARLRKEYSHRGVLPKYEVGERGASTAHDPGNWTYKAAVEVLRIVAEVTMMMLM